MTAERRYRVVAIEPESRLRNKLALQLGGVVDATFASADEAAESTESGLPVVAVFGPSLSDEAGLEVAAKLARTRSDFGIVLLSTELSMDLLRASLRAGVRDAVELEASAVAAREAIERVGETMLSEVIRERADDHVARRGKLVVAFSTKGGVGKSTIATNVAVALAQQEESPVAILDADLQFGDVAVLLGVPPRHTSADAADAIDTLDESLLDELLGTHGPSGLRVLPAPIEPHAGETIPPDALLRMVDVLRTMFSYVVVDMPPRMDDLVLTMLEMADEVLLIASMDIPSIKNLKVGIQTIDLLAVAGDKIRLVLNRANARVNLGVDDVERAVGLEAKFKVPSDIAVPQSVNRGVPVVLDKPKSPAAISLSGIAATIANRTPVDDMVPDEPAHAQGGRRRPWRR